MAPFAVAFAPPIIVLSSGLSRTTNQVFGNGGITYNSFVYSDGPIPAPASLTYLSLNDVVNVANDLSVTSSSGLVTFAAPNLSIVGGNFLLTDSPIVNISLPNLSFVDGNLAMSGQQFSLTGCSLPSLLYVNGAFGSNATTLSSPNLVNVGGSLLLFNVSNFNLNSLQNVGITLTITGCPFPQFPSLTTLGTFGKIGGATGIYLPALVTTSSTAFGFGLTDSTNSLLTLSLPSYTGSPSNFSLTTVGALTTLDLPVMSRCAGAMTISSANSLATFNAPLLNTVVTTLTLAFGAAQVINLPSLVNVGLNLTFSGNNITGINLPLLTGIGSTMQGQLNFPSLTSMTNLNVQSLVGIGGTILFTSLLTTGLNQLVFPSLVSIGYNNAGASVPMHIRQLPPALLPFTGMPALQSVFDTLIISTTVTGFSFPNLAYTWGLTINCPTPSCVFPSLTGIDQKNPPASAIGGLGLSGIGCTGYSFPVLRYVAGKLGISGANVTTINMPILNTITSGLLISPGSGAAPLLTGLSFTGLQYVGPLGIILNANTGISTINFPNIVALSGKFSFAATGHLTNLTLGTSGITMFIGGNVIASGQILTQTSVDSVLTVLASLDGTNGTTLWGPGFTGDFRSGNNAHPSIIGSGAIFLITGRGGSILYNTK